jgi:hypothetical protein
MCAFTGLKAFGEATRLNTGTTVPGFCNTVHADGQR